MSPMAKLDFPARGLEVLERAKFSQYHKKKLPKTLQLHQHHTSIAKKKGQKKV
jgi:hypothetical protein